MTDSYRRCQPKDMAHPTFGVMEFSFSKTDGYEE